MKHIIIIFCFLININCYSSVELNELFLKSIHDMPGYSDQVIMLIGEEIKSQTGSNEFSPMIKQYQKTEVFDDQEFYKQQRISRYETTLKKVNQSYQNLESSRLGLNVTKGITKGLVVAGAAVIGTVGAGPGVGTAIGLSVGQTVAESAVESAANFLGMETQKYVSGVVARVIKEEIGKDREYILEGMTPESAKEVIESFKIQDKIESKLICGDCSPEQNATMNSMAIKNLSNIVRGNKGAIAQFKKDLKLTDEQVERNRKMIYQISDEIGELRKETNKAISNLQNEQVEINQRLNVLGEKVSSNSKNIHQNSKDIKFMKDFLYGKMTPGQKVRAINAGIYGNNFKKEKFELIKMQARFQSHVGNFVNGANQVSAIANNLGIKMPADFSKAVNLGNKAYSAINGAMTSLTSGNYLGAVVSLTGLFGKSVNPANERHKQVMKALGVINQKLDQVLGNQQVMMNQLNQIQQKQDEIFKQLISIERTVLKTAKILYDQIELTRKDVAQNRRALLELVKSSYNNCRTFIYKTNKILNLKTLRLSPYQKRRAYFRTTADKEIFRRCSEILTQLNQIRDRGTPSTQFQLAMQDHPEASSFIRYIEEHYKTFFQLHHLVNKNKKASYLLGLSPVKNVFALKSLYQKINGTDLSNSLKQEEWNNFYGTQINIEELLKNPLLFDSVIEAATLINDFFFYFDIVDNDNLMPLEDIINSVNLGRASNGYLLLLGLKTHLNISLLQTSLLSGQIIIPGLVDHLNDKKIIKPLELLLNQSAVFKKNFFTYLIMNKEKEFVKSFSTNRSSYFKTSSRSLFNYGPYAIACKRRNELYLKQILGQTKNSIFKIKCKRKCQMIIGKTSYDLPRPNELNGGAFTAHPSVRSILSLLGLTNQNLGSYTIHENLMSTDSNEAKNYRILLLESAKRY